MKNYISIQLIISSVVLWSCGGTVSELGLKVGAKVGAVEVSYSTELDHLYLLRSGEETIDSEDVRKLIRSDLGSLAVLSQLGTTSTIAEVTDHAKEELRTWDWMGQANELRRQFGDGDWLRLRLEIKNESEHTLRLNPSASRLLTKRLGSQQTNVYAPRAFGATASAQSSVSVRSGETLLTAPLEFAISDEMYPNVYCIYGPAFGSVLIEPEHLTRQSRAPFLAERLGKLKSCPSFLTDDDAIVHSGTEATVCGNVETIREVTLGEESTVFLNYGGAWNPRFRIAIKRGLSEAEQGDLLLQRYLGKELCITGTISREEGIPQIVVTKDTPLRVVGDARRQVP